MNTAFVAGATGYTGQEVVAALRKRGVRTVAHVRPDSSRRAEFTTRFEALGAEVDCTAWDDAALTARFAELRPDLLFALLGTTASRAKQEAKAGEGSERDPYERVDYGMTMTLVRALVAAGLSTRFVYLSAEGAGNGSSLYNRARWRVETELVASGLPYTIARPSFITGPDREEDRPLERAGAAVTDAALSLLGKLGGRALQARYRSTTAPELAGALVHHGLAAESLGRVLTSDQLRGFGG